MIDVARQTPYRVVWEPLPGSQAIALDTRCSVTLYCGTRGPGKTDCQLMRFRRRVGAGYGQHWRGIIFDCEYKNLDDLIAKSLRWFPQFNDGARFLSSAKDLKWVWPTGEELLFRAASSKKDYYSYHGHEYPFIGWNELTKYPNSELFDMMMSVNRSSFVSPEGLPPIPLEVFATTNPFGVGHNWVKRRFIDPKPYGEPLKVKFNVERPGYPGEFVDVVYSQVAIFGSWRENKFLPPDYIPKLMAEENDAMRKAWLNGDWDIVAGGALDDVWDRRTHVIPRFRIPSHWPIYRCYDHGSSKPFACLWVAVANGEEIEVQLKNRKRIWCPPKDTMIVCGEYYGCRKNSRGEPVNEGLKLAIKEIASGINFRQDRWARQWFGSEVLPGPADNSIWDKIRTDIATIGDVFAEHDVDWERSNKSKGARTHGLQLLRERLWNSKQRNEDPGLFFMQHCVNSLATIPVLPRDEKQPDDVDTDAEDHLYDALRYMALHLDKTPSRKNSFSFV